MTIKAARRTGICLGVLGALAAADRAAGQLPPSIEITGIVRDFKATGTEGGHPDFEPAGPLDGRYAGAFAATIGADGRPVHTGNGARVGEQWRDSAHRQISHLLYENFQQPGDVEGQFEEPSNCGISSTKSFNQWFRDVPVYNLSAPLTLKLQLQPDGMYVFDDLLDPYYSSLGGFFPIDGQLFSDWGSPSGAHHHNYYFTFEIHAQFQYDASAGQSFKFEGTDTVLLFIDGHLVNDLIGVHAAHDQYVEVDRLGLVDGEWYRLDFYFAQRYMPQSHFRVETNILLNTLPITTVSAVFD